MKIMLLNTRDSGGGAEQVAFNLLRTYEALGHQACMAVGAKTHEDPRIFELESAETALARIWQSITGITLGRWPRLRSWVTQPRRHLTAFAGLEDFSYPASRQILNLAPWQPDIIHVRNLHGGYFDLRYLPALSHQVPVVLTLADAWLMTGHCAQPIGCERWRTGCGRCPDLTIYPAIRRDATSLNWARKRRIHLRSRLFLASPSHALLDQAFQSMLAPAITGSRVIPHGVDTAVFRPGDRQEARAETGLPQSAHILLYAGTGGRANPFKDFATLERALRELPDSRLPDTLLLVVLGEAGPDERFGRVSVRFIPFVSDRARLASYYRAADVYVHSTHCEAWGLSVTESLACGTPVIATAVGGLLDQVKTLQAPGLDAQSSKTSMLSEATGILVPHGDSGALASAIRYLLDETAVRHQLGRNAAVDARARFSLEQQAKTYLEWFEQILRGEAADALRQSTARGFNR